MIFFSQLKKIDWGLAISAVLLVSFGLLSLYSIGLARGDFSNFKKQIIFLIIGFLLMIGLSFFDYRILRNNSYLILILYAISLLLLIGLFFFAPLIRGTKGWYKIGPLSFDPLEPTKIILLILLAKYFSMRHVEMYTLKHVFFSGLYIFPPALLVFMKPDLGGAAILVLMWIEILLISGIKRKHFLLLLLIFIILATVSWNFALKDYQRGRIISFLFRKDYLGTSWSQNQARIAIGSGRIFGKGFTKGSQIKYGFLPEPHTDFIFSAIAEEWGLFGVSILFFLYGFLIWRVLRIAIFSPSNFPRLFASGFALLLISQFFINIGMNLSFLPVVGIYLPFVSYGGSALIGNFISLGILQSIKTRI